MAFVLLRVPVEASSGEFIEADVDRRDLGDAAEHATFTVNLSWRKPAAS